MAIFQASAITDKLACLHCAERRDPKTLVALSRTSLSHVCMVALAALTVACATVGPRLEPTLLAPAAEPPTDWSIMRAFARIATALDRPVPAEITDGVVRWELAARDELHELQASLIASFNPTGWIIPDLTVLAIEPVAHTESSGFGWRDDPIRHTRSFHSGTDFRGDPGTPVMAAGDGVVSFVGRRGGYGNVIDIDHGGGAITRHDHRARIETKKDVAVNAGDRIGQVGSTGRTTGPHLHFEVRLDG